jgi:hypothetical protein
MLRERERERELQRGYGIPSEQTIIDSDKQ